MRCKFALPAILHQLPPNCCKITAVPLGGGAVALSVVVAMNKMAEDLARTEDLEMIQNVQQVLDVSQPLVWYIPQKSWCVVYFSSNPSLILCHTLPYFIFIIMNL